MTSDKKAQQAIKAAKEAAAKSAKARDKSAAALRAIQARVLASEATDQKTQVQIDREIADIAAATDAAMLRFVKATE